MLAWLWLPPFGDRTRDMPRLAAELRHCARGSAPLHIVLFGAVVGASVGLQARAAKQPSCCCHEP
eukprot:5065507-Prymnesium_polylepis.2